MGYCLFVGKRYGQNTCWKSLGYVRAVTYYYSYLQLLLYSLALSRIRTLQYFQHYLVFSYMRSPDIALSSSLENTFFNHVLVKPVSEYNTNRLVSSWQLNPTSHDTRKMFNLPLTTQCMLLLNIFFTTPSSSLFMYLVLLKVSYYLL